MRRPYDQRWSVWAAGFGGSQTTDGNAADGIEHRDQPHVTASRPAPIIGCRRDTVAGFALAGGGTNFSVANGGSGRSDLFQAGAFVRHNVGAAYITAALAYGWQDVTTDRTVTDRRHRPAAREIQRQRILGPRRRRLSLRRRRGSAALASRLMPPAQVTTFDLPAYAEQASPAPTPSRSTTARRASPRRAANSASAPTNPSR